jgi:hypothetical protein
MQALHPVARLSGLRISKLNGMRKQIPVFRRIGHQETNH